MCPPGYHHNGFLATHTLGHRMYAMCTELLHCILYLYIYIYYILYIIYILYILHIDRFYIINIYIFYIYYI